ncbi:hypothetical protein HDU97_006287 [Phlyctochytrium planicorne]|nr:hypothetical protein HDU97_006287 [Phlyctochytrium planicorne]
MPGTDIQLFTNCINNSNVVKPVAHALEAAITIAKHAINRHDQLKPRHPAMQDPSAKSREPILYLQASINSMLYCLSSVGALTDRELTESHMDDAKEAMQLADEMRTVVLLLGFLGFDTEQDFVICRKIHLVLSRNRDALKKALSRVSGFIDTFLDEFDRRHPVVSYGDSPVSFWNGRSGGYLQCGFRSKDVPMRANPIIPHNWETFRFVDRSNDDASLLRKNHKTVIAHWRKEDRLRHCVSAHDREARAVRHAEPGVEEWSLEMAYENEFGCGVGLPDVRYGDVLYFRNVKMGCFLAVMGNEGDVAVTVERMAVAGFSVHTRWILFRGWTGVAL